MLRKFKKDKRKELLLQKKPKELICPVRLLYNKIVLSVQKMIPPYKWKNVLLRSTGMKLGKDVCIPHYIHFDPYFPELIRIDDGVIVGGLSSLYTHERQNGKLRLGKIHIKEKTLLAGKTTVRPGVRIGTHVITGMNSLISKDCPDNSFVVGKDKVIKTWEKKDLDRLFYKGTDPLYYKKFKKQTKEFRTNKKQMVLRILNDGKRLNPGNEWYLARPTWRIYYNALFVEFARFCPFNWKRKLLWRMMGAKIGNNVFIGKGTIFDHIYGDKVTIGNNVKIGNNCYFDGHSYTIGESVFGRNVIEDNVKIEDNVMVAPGVRIGKGAHILSNSVIMKEVGEGEIWKGIPAKKQ